MTGDESKETGTDRVHRRGRGDDAGEGAMAPVAQRWCDSWLSDSSEVTWHLKLAKQLRRWLAMLSAARTCPATMAKGPVSRCQHPSCPPGPPVLWAVSDVDRFWHRSGGNEEW